MYHDTAFRYTIQIDTFNTKPTTVSKVYRAITGAGVSVQAGINIYFS